jgi:maleate cis-trans isomerase
VTAIGGYPTHGLAQVRALPHDAPLVKGREVFDQDRSAEAILVACPLWAVGEHTAALEDATGVPVLGIINTMIWAGLRVLGHPGGVQGYGHILQDARNPPRRPVPAA